MALNHRPVFVDICALCRLQNSPYFCVFKYARAVKQKVWNKDENRERDWGETLKIRACEARAVRARKTLTPRFTDFFTDFEEKTDCFAVYQIHPFSFESSRILTNVEHLCRQTNS